VTNAIATSDQAAGFEAMRSQFAAALAAGILPPHVKTPEMAVAIAVKGAEMGFKPYQALEAIEPIQGRYTVKPEALLSLAYEKVPGFICNVVESNDKRAIIDMGRNGVVTFRSTYTMEDATKAGLAGKDNWRRMPVTMLRWRATGAALKVVCPDVRRGMATPEEAEEMAVQRSAVSAARTSSLNDALADRPAPAAVPPPIETTARPVESADTMLDAAPGLPPWSREAVLRDLKGESVRGQTKKSADVLGLLVKTLGDLDKLSDDDLKKLDTHVFENQANPLA
jgi:hypothetical protein